MRKQLPAPDIKGVTADPNLYEVIRQWMRVCLNEICTTIVFSSFSFLFSVALALRCGALLRKHKTPKWYSMRCLHQKKAFANLIDAGG